jgi:hypothetical protein
VKITSHPLDGYYNTEVQMVWKIWNESDPSVKLPKGSRTHNTLESVDYALDLMSSNWAHRIQRAVAIFSKIIELQNQDTQCPRYGLWPKYLETPLHAAEAPDVYWADVIGFRLCKVLARYKQHIPHDITEKLQQAIVHAAWSIHRRNLASADSRVAFISAIVLLVGGEVEENVILINFGRDRLREIVERIQRGGEFGEYNSPTLTLLALEECEYLVDLVHDKSCLVFAQQLTYVAWRTISEHFHPATEQWAGPHGWIDQDTLTKGQITELVDKNLGCPADLEERLGKLPTDEISLQYHYLQLMNESGDALATTWISEDVCLGSMDEELMWQRRRPLIGYWQSKNGGVAVLRARFLHDGHDFASGLIRSVQSGRRILSAFSLDRHSGDLHPVRDRPENGIFRATDFRVRYQLTADDASIEEINEGAYRMSSGSYVAILHTLPGYFHKTEIRWTFGRDGDTVFVDAVCYTGERRIIRPRNVRTVLVAAGLEILRKGAEASDQPLLLRQEDQQFLLKWPNLELNFSSRPRS